jgi:glucose/arabinose dehydrogenase
VPITGTERLGWNQPAGDAAELASFSYALYVDGVRSALNDVSCEATPSQAGFACSVRLPAMSPGPHALELAAFVLDGGSVIESSRSAPLQVIVGASARGSGSLWSSATTVATVDRVRLRLEPVAEGLMRPADIAIAEDGRIFIAERAGRVRIVRDGRLLDAPALELPDVAAAGDAGLLALALSPDFGRIGLVYALYTTTTPSGTLGFRLARFRVADDALAERTILLDGVPASPGRTSAALRFGADGMLYAALDDAGDSRRAGDLSSFSGKLLRLSPDGTTPRDQPAATPVTASGLRAPRGLGWNPGTGTLWVLDEDAAGRASLRAINASQSALRLRAVGPAHVLASTASSLAFYRTDRIAAFRHNLFVAAGGGRQLLRLRLAPHDSGVESTERLLDVGAGGVRAIAVGPDGAIYVCSDRALARLVPE